MSLYRRALGYFRDDATRIGVSLALVILLTLLGLLVPVPLAIFFNLFDESAGRGEGFVYRLFDFIPRQRTLGVVLLLAAATVALRLANELLRTIQAQLRIVAGYHGRARVQTELFQKLIAHSPFGARRAQGDLLYRIGHDTEGFQALLNTVFGWFVNLVALVAILLVMLDLNWRLTLVALVVGPVLVLAMIAWNRRLRVANNAQKQADSAVTTQAQRAISSLALVQSFGREPYESATFAGHVSSFVGASLRLHRRELLYWLTIGAVLALGSAGLLALGGWLVFRRELSLGSLWLFISYLGSLYEPLNQLSSSTTSLQTAVAGVRRVFIVLDAPDSVGEPADAVRLPLQRRAIVFEDVTFAYDEAAPVLREVSLRIEPGEFVAFVGPSGAGKTTLLNLVPRFFDPVAGRVLLGDTDLRRASLADLRRHVALVLQDNPVLPATVRENLTYGRPGAGEALVRSAAVQAGADGFIERLPFGYETLLGEEGTGLSVGQRQRLAIARALLAEAPILLLDEPTSGLDAETERQIVETFLQLRGERTLVVVSHRLSTARVADRICVLESGRIVEEGRHEALLARGGLYATLASDAGLGTPVGNAG